MTGPATGRGMRAGADDVVLEFDHASIGYGDRTIVQEVSLRIARGEVVALVGPNGSGKTTMVRGLLGLAPVLQGEIRLFGTRAAHLHQRWRLGYVPQRHTIAGAIPSTVEEVVSSGRLARRAWWRVRATSQDRGQIRRAIEEVGLGEHRRAPVSTLSGGQQRRVLIARALAADPEVLVMDEPTAGVDAASSEALTRTLGRLLERGLTMLVVTHDVRPLAPILTRVVSVEDGRVAADRPAGVLPLVADTAEHGHCLPEDDPPHLGLVARGPLR